ncbi:hypothetical protein SESBI_18330 [Sesbania bispinosa]|nr:hypothetical protein SESBI_18330 [Sesbania bispinosa]
MENATKQSTTRQKKREGNSRDHWGRFALNEWVCVSYTHLEETQIEEKGEVVMCGRA